ncbi:PEST proteolytic signal-containing nuclear protein-like isoform X2 [Anthonomus grandis grandis]|uniref:PEST proteolytic signal-containing nuclear protein-like isoform X2 n=1 Tax=Anthonomus grandis grandis TaxID=2921223 RepID=UPI002165C2B8|nr:PEST proteolytic signal-containing nuclear protein-like isoform X2 [Anthonomus grandis grandis]
MRTAKALMCLLGSRERSRSRSPLQDSKKDDGRERNIGLAPKNRLKSLSIQMKLNPNQKPTSNKPKMTVAAVFNQDSDDEPEQMPPEARMRMRNIGRDTPTSSGPNSFGKTKHGFSDAKKIFEKNLKEAMEAARADD